MATTMIVNRFPADVVFSGNAKPNIQMGAVVIGNRSIFVRYIGPRESSGVFDFQVEPRAVDQQYLEVWVVVPQLLTIPVADEGRLFLV